jgi:lysophospholipase L1-like esterase
MRLFSLLPLLLIATSLRAESLLPPNARVAVIGDSITEQKIYSKYIETYLLACTGKSDIKVFQFGWSGERAGGFAARLENDLAVFNPNVATTCYGMNDGSYTAFTPQIGGEYEKNMRAILAGFGKVGVKVVAVGSPGGVDPDFFTRPTIKGEIYNENLAQLRDIAKKLAEENKQPFANVHDTMMSALAKSKAALGKGYGPFGGDGFHPAPAGQLLMAQAFLKALGFDGEIGTITVDLKGQSTASSGHVVKSGQGGSVSWRVRSGRSASTPIRSRGQQSQHPALHQLQSGPEPPHASGEKPRFREGEGHLGSAEQGIQPRAARSGHQSRRRVHSDAV